MFSKLVLLVLIFLVGTIGTGWGDNRPSNYDVYVHGWNSSGKTSESVVRYRVQDTKQAGLIYTLEGTKKIRMTLILPGEKTSSTLTDTLIYKDNQSRDQGLERMDPLYAARLRGIDPQIIAPTMPGEGTFSVENNTRVLEGWIRALSDKHTGRNLNMLVHSQAVNFALTVLSKQENHGRVRIVKAIEPAIALDPAFGPAKLKSDDALKGLRLDNKASQQQLRSLSGIDPGTAIVFYNLHSGVVSQPKMVETVTVLQKAGIQATLEEAPGRIYNKTPEAPAGFGPATNKGVVYNDPIPEITHENTRWGRHLMGTFLNHANFGTLFEGMQISKGPSGNLSQGDRRGSLYSPLNADAIGLGTGTRFGDLTKSLDRNWSKGLDFQRLDKIRLNSESIDLGKIKLDDSSKGKYKDVDIRIKDVDIRIK